MSSGDLNARRALQSHFEWAERQNELALERAERLARLGLDPHGIIRGAARSRLQPSVGDDQALRNHVGCAGREHALAIERAEHLARLGLDPNGIMREAARGQLQQQYPYKLPSVRDDQEVRARILRASAEKLKQLPPVGASGSSNRRSLVKKFKLFNTGATRQSGVCAESPKTSSSTATLHAQTARPTDHHRSAEGSSQRLVPSSSIVPQMPPPRYDPRSQTSIPRVSGEANNIGRLFLGGREGQAHGGDMGEEEIGERPPAYDPAWAPRRD